MAAPAPPPNVTLRTIAQEPLVLLCRSDHRLGARDRVSVPDLATETVIRFAAGWGIRRQADDAFTAAGITPDTPYEVSDYDTAAGLVGNRLGVTLLPATPAGRYPDLVTVAVTPVTTWTLALAASARFPPSAAASALAETLLEEGRR